MKRKKVNPHRQPATAADVEQARKQGQDEGLRLAWVLFFTVLRDKFGWGKIRLARLWNGIADKSDSIAKGYATLDDLEDELSNAGIVLTDGEHNNHEKI